MMRAAAKKQARAGLFETGVAEARAKETGT